jgi:hypothetical protein
MLHDLKDEWKKYRKNKNGRARYNQSRRDIVRAYWFAKKYESAASVIYDLGRRDFDLWHECYDPCMWGCKHEE